MRNAKVQHISYTLFG